MAIVNYNQDVNHACIEQASLMLAVTFSDGDEYKVLYNPIQTALTAIDRAILSSPLSERKQVCKDIKDGLKAQWGRFSLTGDLPESPFLSSIASCDIPKSYKMNIMASIVRWPEFYLHTEQYMHQMTADLKNHKDMINSITYSDKNGRICPYDPKIGMIESSNNESVWQTMENQYESCKQFLNSHNDNLVISIDDIKDAFNTIETHIMTGICSDFEKGFIADIRYMRKHIGRVADQMRRIAEGDIKSVELTLSESASVIKNEKVLVILKQMGWKGNTIPQVLANMFSMNYPNVHLQAYDGQISLEINGEFFEPALGLGPAYKLRVVFNTHNQANNFLEPLAALIKKSHKINDPCEDYLDQGAVIQSEANMITDVIDLDATGYSDYLARTIYTLCMNLYHVPSDIQDKVMAIFRFPILIGEDLEFPAFGTEQGCKLVVFLMNTANRLLGVLSRLIYKKKYHALDGHRANVGDDVEDHIFTGKFPQEYLDIQVSVFTLFNCPTNSQKCGWLSRDGIVSYCSRYYYLAEGGKGLISCGGIPPKTLGKQIISFSAFAQIYKVLNRNKIVHRPAIEVWEIMAPLLKPDMILACQRFTNIHGEHSDFNKKEEAAKKIDVELGGLLEGEFEKNTEKYLDDLKYRFSQILCHYVFDAAGVFIIANKLIKEDCELWKCLATVHRTSVKDIMHMMSILTSDDNIYSIEDLDWCRSCINRMERAIIKGTSISSSSSTYHRNTPLRDIDLLYNDDEEARLDFSSDWINNSSDPLKSLALFIDMYSSDEYTTIDNIRRYYRCEYLMKKYCPLVEDYSGVAYFNSYAYKRVKNPETGKYVRMLESYNDIYNTKRRGYSNFETQEDTSPEIREFIEVYKASTNSRTYGVISGIYSTILTKVKRGAQLSEIERLIRQKTNLSYAEVRRMARDVLSEIEKMQF